MRKKQPAAPSATQTASFLSATPLCRRAALRALASLGLGTAAFQRALAAEAEGKPEITSEMIQQAEWIAGIELTEEDRKLIAAAVKRDQDKLAKVRQVTVDYNVPPALAFFAAPPQLSTGNVRRDEVRPLDSTAPERPESDEDLAFLPVTTLGALLRTRKLSSVELARLYLGRLKRFNEMLNCVVSFTEELAMRQAERADREIAEGRYRGPLHGIPWGAKDLIAVPGYKTTWGASVFKEQTLEVTATVAQRLEDAGAVLVAKLALGALAMGDEWFGGMTRNPWKPEEGSSGSSAGSASAVAAGLVGFALGSETLGSIVSPCRRCSATGLRPTFGRVSRYGCMTLSWSMDKIGPIARSVEDCALVLNAIHGYDGFDSTAVNRPFSWPMRREVNSLRVGYIEGRRPLDERTDIRILRELGVQLVPIKLPASYPIRELNLILDTEAAAVFDTLTRKGVRDGIGRWRATFGAGQYVPAVEYLRANRVRTLVMREMESMMADIDAYVGGDDLALTNMTGHPTVVVPDGLRRESATEQPDTVTFTGKLFGESDLLGLAHAYQQASGAYLRRPPLERLLAAKRQAANPSEPVTKE